MFGQLGHGGEGNEVVPRLIETLNRVVVVKVEAGSDYSIVLTRDGGVLTWGGGLPALPAPSEYAPGCHLAHFLPKMVLLQVLLHF